MRIVNPEGLHARPCHAIVTLAAGFESELEVSCGSHSVNGRSILALMTLSAPAGAELRFRARGDDAARLLERVTRLVASGFEERA